MMPSPRVIFYNRKSYWKRLAKKANIIVMDLLNREVRGDLQLTLTDYFETGNFLVKIGLEGESLAKRAVNLGLTPMVLTDLKDTTNILAMLSERLRDVAEKKWGQDLPTFPVYHTDMEATTELIDQADSIREMHRMLGED
jgi:hypothetical protein